MSWYTGGTFRGVDYSPTWPSWVVGTGAVQTADSDFANDAFQSFWSNLFVAAPSGDTSAPVQNTIYRNDLGTIAKLGFNLVRLYNWDMARGTTSTSNTGLDHINFLNYAGTLGIKVVVPVSDYFLSDDQYAWNGVTPSSTYSFGSAPAAIQTDFSQFIASITDPATGKIHSAIHSISVGNEGDIGQGISGTNPSNFLARTIWWIYNLNQTISAMGSPVPLSATFSNADQGGGSSSWFGCVINGVSTGDNTPYGCALGPQFPANVTGLASADSSYTGYYYNSFNVSQVSMTSPYPNTLAQTAGQYDSGSTGAWPWGKFNVPLLMMEVFTPNRTAFTPTTDQATAAAGQAKALEAYLAQNQAGTASSTTNLMGYNYFEFNDEQQVKLTGLYEYGTSSTNAQTGTTSVDYPPYQFPNYTFPVVSLSSTPGPGGSGTLAQAWTQYFPQVVLQGTIVAAFGSQGSWQATFYTGSALPGGLKPGMHVRGPGIPAGTTVASVSSDPHALPPMAAVLANPATQSANPFVASQTQLWLKFSKA